MATNMDPPQPLKKKNYLDAVKSSTPQELDKQYIAVPGLQGETGLPGPKGDKGDKGDTDRRDQKEIKVDLAHKESVESLEKAEKAMIHYLDSTQDGYIIKIN
jgi:hypothetical protein